jgi:hypothetical protein
MPNKIIDIISNSRGMQLIREWEDFYCMITTASWARKLNPLNQ